MRSAALAALVVVALAAAPVASAAPGRIAVGVADGASVDDVALRVEQATGRSVDRDLAPVGAVIVSVEDVEVALPALQAIPHVEFVEQIERNRSLAFVPDDPLVEGQWYLQWIRAFDQWTSRPDLPAVRVAVIDSGIDAGHPEFAGRIAAGMSFVKGSRWDVDALGHGTLVAGEIAAAVDNQQGIAGVGFPVQLLVAKVTGANTNISVEAEAEAIRWAADQGAQVINLSLSGTRNPRDPTDDEFSPLEQEAIEYAYERGVVVVAASGNCPADHSCPWRYAGYPAALPHVIGVGALAADGTVPTFSNRDPVYVDVSAPGVSIVSTFPRDLTTDPGCAHPGYSVCADDPTYRPSRAKGTSFAAPLVSAAAALLLSQSPGLSPSQVTALVELGAERLDLGKLGRDAGTGAGGLDVVELLAAAITRPPSDAWEVNDDAGQRARRVPLRSSRTIRATIDYYDDPTDVYRVYLRRGREFVATLRGSLGGSSTLVLWRPGTRLVSPVTQVAVRSGAILGWRKGAKPVLRFTASRNGWYYVEVKAPRRGGGEYRLTISQKRAAG